MTARYDTRLMAPGSFTIDLDRSEKGRILAPEHIIEMTASAFAAVLVMPGKITNPAKVPLAQLYADAAYVGIHVGRPNVRGGFSGYGPSWLLKLARQPKDQKLSKRPLYDGTNTSAIPSASHESAASTSFFPCAAKPASNSAMAIEYGSSPVEHGKLRIRRGRRLPISARRFLASRPRVANDSG